MRTDLRQDRDTAQHEVRCHCHRLLARIDAKQVVLRCPRCKQEAVLEVTADEPGSKWIAVKL